MNEAQNVAGYFLDHVWVGEIGRKQRHVALKLGAHGLEALDLELQQAGTFDQSFSSFEAVAAIDGVMSEISRQS